MLQEKGGKVCAGAFWGAGSTFWCKLKEIAVFCALNFMSFYGIPELLIVDFIFIASQKQRPQIPHRNLSLMFIQSWNSSAFLTCSLASLACLSNHLVSAGFFPSFLSPELCPGSLWPFRRAPLLWKEWGFFSFSSASGVTEVQRHKKCGWGLPAPAPRGPWCCDTQGVLFGSQIPFSD